MPPFPKDLPTSAWVAVRKTIFQPSDNSSVLNEMKIKLDTKNISCILENNWSKDTCLPWSLILEFCCIGNSFPHSFRVFQLLNTILPPSPQSKISILVLKDSSLPLQLLSLDYSLNTFFFFLNGALTIKIARTEMQGWNSRSLWCNLIPYTQNNEVLHCEILCRIRAQKREGKMRGERVWFRVVKKTSTMRGTVRRWLD